MTPIEIPIKGKKLFQNNSYDDLTINLFDENYGKYEITKNTKKQFIENRSYYDHIKEQGLISKMEDCWKKRRSSSISSGFRTGIEFTCYRNINNMNLRNYNKNKNRTINKFEGNKYLSKIIRLKNEL